MNCSVWNKELEESLSWKSDQRFVAVGSTLRRAHYFKAYQPVLSQVDPVSMNLIFLSIVFFKNSFSISYIWGCIEMFTRRGYILVIV